MNFNTKKLTIITVKITLIKTEQMLNALWKNNIRADNIRKIDAATLTMNIYGEDYEDVKKIVKRCNGKIKILKRKGTIVKLSKIRKRLSFVIGGGIFLIILFLLSTFIWAIDIETEKNVSPFEVRKMINNLGIHQGMSKRKINVYDLEKKIEDYSSEILWVRARMEGSSLKIKVEEKVNPPKLLDTYNKGVVARKDGEVKRIYTKFGTPAVAPGDMVKEGDTLIYPYDGDMDEKYEVNPQGVVIATVFYERTLEIQIKGEKLERTGNKDSDIYINLGGKKIYLKKATNSFKNYDKIEDKDGMLRSVNYYEMKSKKINLNKEKAVENSMKKLEEFLKKDLTNEAKIVGKTYDVLDVNEEKIKVIAQFAVEENIAS